MPEEKNWTVGRAPVNTDTVNDVQKNYTTIAQIVHSHKLQYRFDFVSLFIHRASNITPICPTYSKLQLWW